MCQICENSISEDSQLILENCTVLTEIPTLPPHVKILRCSKCPNMVKIHDNPELEVLSCYYTTNLESLPNAPKLRILRFWCPKIKTVPNYYPNLIELSIDSAAIEEIPSFPNLKELDCVRCQIKKIPRLPNLLKLTCYYCKELTEIKELPELVPNLTQLCCSFKEIPFFSNLECLYIEGEIEVVKSLPNLRMLYVNGKKNLREIECMPKLDILHCESCPKLKFLPNFPNLGVLHCSRSTNLIYQPSPEFVRLVEEKGRPFHQLTCSHCPWVNYRDDTDRVLQDFPTYEENIQKLVKIQRFWRKYRKIYLARKWINTKEFAEWYYHPDNRGGKMATLNFMKLIRKIRN